MEARESSEMEKKGTHKIKSKRAANKERSAHSTENTS